MKENGLTLKKARSRWYPRETITNADYTDYQVLLVNTPVRAECLKQAARGIGFYVKSNKTDFMYLKKKAVPPWH